MQSLSFNNYSNLHLLTLLYVNRVIYFSTYILMVRWTERETDRQTDRQTDIQTKKMNG